MGARRSIDELVAEARSTYSRVTAPEAWGAMNRGAVLVDTRSPDQQLRQGLIPGRPLASGLDEAVAL